MVVHESERRSRPVYGEGVRKVTKQILVGPHDGFAGYLREFTLQPGGQTPYHQHDWPHVVYVLSGQGTVRYEGVENPLSPGSVVYTEPNKMHGFGNSGADPLRFLCLVPERGDAYSEEDA
jgi:quercetin dioxygenase-like cupin family protein